MCLLILEGERLCLLQLHAARFSGSLRQVLRVFLGHMFEPQWVQKTLTECIMFLLTGSSYGPKIQRRIPFGKNTSCYTTCYTENYKIRQLQTGTEMFWLCLPCESNTLEWKTTPSDYFYQSMAHSQGSLSYGGLI